MRVLLLSMLSFMLLGCSSIIEGRSQQLMVNTTPPGAKCTVLRQGIPIGTVNPTPGEVYIEKTKDDITVECEKVGYQKATFLNHSGAPGATWGNIVAGGFIAADGVSQGIDGTGADNKYETPMNITLVPEGKHASE